MEVYVVSSVDPTRETKTTAMSFPTNQVGRSAEIPNKLQRFVASVRT